MAGPPESEARVRPDLDRNARIAEHTERRRRDLERCWLCEGPTLAIHCKIVRRQCGFQRDCSVP
jgi:hypothetical protein